MKHWLIDKDHSEVSFKIQHLTLVFTRGKVVNFDVELLLNEEEFRASKFKFTADLNSLNTLHEFRDKRIKEKDILNVSRYPKLSFNTLKIEASTTPNKYKLIGGLSLKGITKPVETELFVTGKAKDSYSGEIKRGYRIKAVIDRRDWGVDFNLPFEGKGVAVGNKVYIHAELEFKKVD